MKPELTGGSILLQVKSMIRCCAAVMLALEIEDQGSSCSEKRTFVDFCGGAGHVGVLIAWLFPEWNVVCVDLVSIICQCLQTSCACPCTDCVAFPVQGACLR